MLTKTCPAQFKAIDAAAADLGIVEMVVSTYGVDSWGDRVMPGAFADTLAEWKASGNAMPFVFAHQSNDPDMYVGTVLDIKEQAGDPATTPPTPPGLWVKAQMDDEPKAKKVLKLMNGRRVTQASFAYDIVDSAMVKEDGDTINELRKLKLYECGPCLIGMQQETTLLNVKDAKTLRHIIQDFKSGRVISAKNEELLRTAHESIGAVLAAISDDGKATTDVSGKAEEPSQAKAEDSTHPSTAELEALDSELQIASLGL